jgi:hypothetical protein
MSCCRWPRSPRRPARSSTGRAGSGLRDGDSSTNAVSRLTARWTCWPTRWASSSAPAPSSRSTRRDGGPRSLDRRSRRGAGRHSSTPSRHARCRRGDVVLATWPPARPRAGCRTASRSSPAPRPACRPGRHGTAAELGLVDGDEVTSSAARRRRGHRPGPVTDGMVDGVIWLPTNSRAARCALALGVDAGARVTVTKGGAMMHRRPARPERSTTRGRLQRHAAVAHAGQGAVHLRLPAHLDPARHLVRAAGHRSDAAASGPEPQRPVRSVADARRRYEVDVQGGRAPAAADKFVFTLAPLIVATMCFVSFGIMPMGGEVSMFGHRTPLQLTDAPVAVLLVLAVASSASTASSWPAGPPARPTRCSVGCARAPR